LWCGGFDTRALRGRECFSCGGPDSFKNDKGESTWNLNASKQS
jgi:hypothetical protein